MRPKQGPRRGDVPRHAFCLAVFIGVLPGSLFAADDPQVAQLLQAGRQAYQDHNYPQAADRFRELLQKYPQAAEVSAARLALGRILVEGPQKNYEAALDALKPLLEDKDFPERAQVLYHA